MSLVSTQGLVATFSIIGFDPETEELGIAVQSKFLGVGAVVPWARAGVGAIATQSWANTSFGPKGLQLLEEGFSPDEVVELLIRNDENREFRQFAVMDSKGNTAAYTGKSCFDWAGHVNGQNFSCQGNILVGEDTVRAMADSFQKSTGALAERLIQALTDGQEAGGDSRGKQSAALYVVKAAGGYSGFNDRYIDIRVDDHPEPFQELKRLYQLHRLYFGKSENTVLLKLEDSVLQDVVTSLHRLGYLAVPSAAEFTPDVQEALKSFFHNENFEEKWRDDDQIEIELFGFIKERAAFAEASKTTSV